MPGPRKFKAVVLRDSKPPKSEPEPKATAVSQTMPTTTLNCLGGCSVGAGTKPFKKYTREDLKIGWSTLSGRVIDWLNEGNRLETMMAETKLRDLGVLLGIATEKVLLLEGSPTQIIGQAEQKKLEDLMPALLMEVKRRGVKAELTERTVTVDVPAVKPNAS